MHIYIHEHVNTQKIIRKHTIRKATARDNTHTHAHTCIHKLNTHTHTPGVAISDSISRTMKEKHMEARWGYVVM